MSELKTMEDPDDLGLKSVMGDKFQDHTKAGDTAAPNKSEKAMDARWEPASGKRTEVEVLKGCIKAMLPFSVICPVLLYWQISGLLDPKAAEVSIIICALLLGLRVGHAVGKGC